MNNRLPDLINIEVAYASLHSQKPSQKVISLKVLRSISVEQAIECSGILEIFPEIDLRKQKVGIFSQIVELADKVVEEGARIEIYRPLLMDPKDRRRLRYSNNIKS